MTVRQVAQLERAIAETILVFLKDGLQAQLPVEERGFAVQSVEVLAGALLLLSECAAAGAGELGEEFRQSAGSIIGGN